MTHLERASRVWQATRSLTGRFWRWAWSLPPRFWRWTSPRRLIVWEATKRKCRFGWRHFRWTFHDFDYHEDPWYIEECSASDAIAHPPENLTKEDLELLERVGWESFSAANESRDRLLARLADVLTAASAMAVLLVTAVQGFQLPSTGWTKAAFICFLSASVIVAMSRRPTKVLTLPRLKYLADHLPKVQTSHAYCTAIAVYNASLAVQSNCRFLAQRLNAGTLLMVVGIFCLFPIIF